jgi:chorismate mutase / prephenate dehydrogenase
MSETRLESIRDRIRALDEELVKLAGERVELARAAGEIKREEKRTTVDYAHERVVLERARAAAGRTGLDPSVAEDLVARLIRASVTAQEEDNLRRAGTGAGKSAVILGGAGRMGRWMRRFLLAQGYSAFSLDPAASGEENALARDHLDGAGLVVCATPPGAIPALYDGWLSRPPRGVVVDLASIKTPVIEAIRRLQKAGAHVASIHPMFGPSIALLRDADVVICDTGDAAAMEATEALFRPTTARLVRLPLAEHDRIMADLLALAHATAIAFALSLPRERHPVHSTTFQALERLSSEVVRESPEVYYEIQAENPSSLAALERLRLAVERILATVKARKPDEFRKLLEEGRARTQAPAQK